MQVEGPAVIAKASKCIELVSRIAVMQLRMNYSRPVCAVGIITGSQGLVSVGVLQRMTFHGCTDQRSKQ